MLALVNDHKKAASSFGRFQQTHESTKATQCTQCIAAAKAVHITKFPTVNGIDSHN